MGEKLTFALKELEKKKQSEIEIDKNAEQNFQEEEKYSKFFDFKKKNSYNVVEENAKKDNQHLKINPFSASAFKNIEQEIDTREENRKIDDMQEVKNEAKPSSTILETPNYDFIESLTEAEKKRIFKEEEKIEIFDKKEKKMKFNLKSFVFSLLFIVLGIWGIVNISTIDSINGQIATVTESYNLNLANYLKNLATIDATNKENMENLFEVIPHEQYLPTEISDTSNWFDRFCNFLAGLFGG